MAPIGMKWSFLFAVLLPVAGCDLLGGGPPAGSCDFRPDGSDRCWDYPKSEIESGKKVCDGKKVWSDKPCDHTGALIGCKVESRVGWIFPLGGMTKEKAIEECGGKVIDVDKQK